MTDEWRELWRIEHDGTEISCILVSCCAGAELQLLSSGETVLRELYPDKSSLYERARELHAELLRPPAIQQE